MDKIDLSKTHAAMRSVYRFLEFSSMNSPDILIDTERDILRRHFTELSAEEIVYILTHFDDYCEVQEKQTVNEAQEAARYLNNLN